MTDSEYDFITKVLREQSAISLDPGKRYLVESRLAPVIQRLGLASVSEFIQQLKLQRSSRLVTELVEAMVTTESTFFRDLQPFEILRTTVLPQLIAARKTTREISLWSAACASGQEPYSLAMLIREHFPMLTSWKVRLFATDISQEMVKRTREGKYTELEVSRGLPAELLAKHFEAVGSVWQARQHLREMVDVQQRNLASAWPVLEQFDVIFLRNVMIYFETEDKKTILQRVARSLRPDGYLVLGAAETTLGLCETFARSEALKAGYFQLSAVS